MNLSQLAQGVVIALAVLGVYGFVGTARDGETRRACTALCALKPDYAGRNRTAPDFELKDLDGRPVRLSSLRGKTVILHFWTKTCRPCLEELPNIAAFAKVLKPFQSDIQLVTITTDEDAADARATLKSVLGSDTDFMVLVDPDGDQVVAGKYGTKLFPETWFIDKQGVIRVRFDGPRDWKSALPLDLARALSAPIPCEVAYSAGRATGAYASLCGQVVPGT